MMFSVLELMMLVAALCCLLGCCCFCGLLPDKCNIGSDGLLSSCIRLINSDSAKSPL